MKFKIFTLLLTLGTLIAAPLIYTGTLNPMALFDSAFNFAKTETDSLTAQLPDKLTRVGREEKVQVYKWRDANGVMQFSNAPPMDTQAEQVTLDPNTNLVQAVKVEVKKESPPQEQQVQAKMPKPYSVKGMKKVMDDARGVEELLQKRHETQKNMLQNL